MYEDTWKWNLTYVLLYSVFWFHFYVSPNFTFRYTIFELDMILLGEQSYNRALRNQKEAKLIGLVAEFEKKINDKQKRWFLNFFRTLISLSVWNVYLRWFSTIWTETTSACEFRQSRIKGNVSCSKLCILQYIFHMSRVYRAQPADSARCQTGSFTVDICSNRIGVSRSRQLMLQICRTSNLVVSIRGMSAKR